MQWWKASQDMVLGEVAFQNLTFCRPGLTWNSGAAALGYASFADKSWKNCLRAGWDLRWVPLLPEQPGAVFQKGNSENVTPPQKPSVVSSRIRCTIEIPFAENSPGNLKLPSLLSHWLPPSSLNMWSSFFPHPLHFSFYLKTLFQMPCKASSCSFFWLLPPHRKLFWPWHLKLDNINTTVSFKASITIRKYSLAFFSVACPSLRFLKREQGSCLLGSLPPPYGTGLALSR
jgi:hypothetical protein